MKLFGKPENYNAVSAATLHQSSFETRRDAPGSQRQAAKEWTARRRSPIEKHFQKHNNDKYFIVMCFAMFTCLPHTHTYERGAFEHLALTCDALLPCCPVAESANRPRRFYNCLNSMYSHYFSRVWRMLLPVYCGFLPMHEAQFAVAAASLFTLLRALTGNT